MARRQPSSDLRGILLPEQGILDATVTASSQAGPRAGVVVPDQVTGLVLHGTGELDANSEAASQEIELATVRGGNVGEATVRWRFAGGTLRSWDAPVAMAGWEYIDRTTTADRYRAPHAVRRASTGLACVSVTYDTNTVKVWRQSETGKWVVATVEDTGAETRATLVDLPSGRLVCVYTVSVSATTTQLRSAYSDDGGATWTTGTKACLASAFAGASSTVRRLRAVELNGQVCLVLWSSVTADEVYQYVSSDGGNLFVKVETVSTSAMAYPDLSVSRGNLYFLALQYSAAYSPSTVRAQVRRLTSASQPISSASTVDVGTASVWGTYSAGAFTAGDATIAATDDGFLWVYGTNLDGAGTRPTIARASPDNGATWYDNFQNSRGENSGTLVHWNGDQTASLREVSACPERGRVLLAHTPQTAPGGVTTNYPSLCAAYLGGWSTVGMPDPLDGEWWEQAGWDAAYVPLDLPTDTGTLWTRSLSGAATEALGASGLTVTATGADRLYYDHAPTISSNIDQGILAEVQITATAGTSSLELRMQSGGNGFWIRANVTTTQVEIVDLGTGGAGTQLHTLAIDATKGIVLRIALDKPSGAWTSNIGRVRSWARIDGPYLGGAVNHGPRQDREWTHVGVSSTLTSSAFGTNRVRFGSIDAAGTGTYRWVFFSTGQYTGGNIADSVTGDIHGAIVPPASSPMHLTDGARISGINGPTTSGDTYSMSPAYEYPVSAIHPVTSPSPRRVWRSTLDGVQQDIVFTGCDLGARTGDTWGVYVAGANWQTATLYRDSTGTNKVLDLDLSAGLTGLGYDRTRDLVIPKAGGTAAGIYFGAESLKGCYLDFGSWKIRKILSNTSGPWLAAGAGTYASTRIQLESYGGSDPTTGIDAKLRMSRGLWVLETMASTDTLMLRIPAQDTSEDYFTLGTLIIGRIRWFGQQYSRGRGLSFTPAYELSETRSGARRVRKLGPTRRAYEVAWDDGVDTSQLAALSSGAPDYWNLGYTGADAVADIAGTPRTLAGVIQQTRGAYLPVVLAPAVPQQSSAPGTVGIPILDPERHFHGRIVTETLRLDSDPNVMGHEFSSPGEMVKVSSVVIEEEV